MGRTNKREGLTPEDVKQVVGSEEARIRRQHAKEESFRREGFKEGLKKGHQDLLEFLETAYMDPKIERGTPEAKAILQVAQDAALHFRGLEEKERNRR